MHRDSRLDHDPISMLILDPEFMGLSLKRAKHIAREIECARLRVKAR